MSTEKQARKIQYKYKHYILLILVFCFLSCVKNYKSNNCSVNYIILPGNNISINRTEAEAEFFPIFRHTREGRISVEIVIFSYSSGKELFSYSGDHPDSILTDTQTGRIEALLKIKQDDHLKEVLFINAVGNSKKEILHRLAIASREALCGF